jgi:hypothetical protein
MTQLIQGLISDPSWRVRYMVGDKFCELSSALGAGIAQSDALLDDYVKLLSDPEPEVRTASAARVGDIAKLAGEQQTIKKFFKPMNQGKTPTQSVLQAICADTDEATSFTRGEEWKNLTKGGGTQHATVPTSTCLSLLRVFLFFHFFLPFF